MISVFLKTLEILFLTFMYSICTKSYILNVAQYIFMRIWLHPMLVR